METIGSCRVLNNSFLDARGLSQRRPANIFIDVTVQIQLKKHGGLTKLTPKLINHHGVCVCVCECNLFYRYTPNGALK